MLWPPVPAWRIDGELWLDRKFKDGMDAWCARWPGRVRVVMDVVQPASRPAFGAYRWEDGQAAFDLRILEAGESHETTDLAGVDLLLASGDEPRHLVAAQRCEGTATACVFAIEYTLRTRIGLTLHTGAPPFKMAKVLAWQLLNELRVSRAMRRARGVQANGIPVFRAYQRECPAINLYFDTRLPLAAVIGPEALEERLGQLAVPGPLRLAFSGRLIEGKGADALVPLARLLTRRNVAFTLDIYGSGELEGGIRDDIAAHGLGANVRLNGPLDFDSELVPRLKEAVDIFVCCHRQGDPSCTYAETLGCGVPIAGFDNEALESMVRAHDIGWTVRLGNTPALADLIARLAGDREEIARKSRTAMRFGQEHHFESAFATRTEHCIDVLRLIPGHSQLPHQQEST